MRLRLYISTMAARSGLVCAYQSVHDLVDGSGFVGDEPEVREGGLQRLLAGGRSGVRDGQHSEAVLDGVAEVGFDAVAGALGCSDEFPGIPDALLE